MPPREGRSRERTTLRADVAEGLHYLWRHRLLRSLAAMTGLFNLATNATSPSSCSTRSPPTASSDGSTAATG
jgi:hypothetical protein